MEDCVKPYLQELDRRIDSPKRSCLRVVVAVSVLSLIVLTQPATWAANGASCARGADSSQNPAKGGDGDPGGPGDDLSPNCVGTCPGNGGRGGKAGSATATDTTAVANGLATATATGGIPGAGGRGGDGGNDGTVGGNAGDFPSNRNVASGDATARAT